ncbi:hypothetical protein [Streptomyces sp. NBRC 110028]|uniref:hypothetical protein n=1 Tax=Streptomyces sp. NBRC 110028 TaxID=1621260 RepID=UPI0006E277D8|nr:hypothetical protein [Streptomyces sp. NBRC 110028]
MNLVTNRLRGRAGRRIAATIVAAAALGLGATACGPDDGAASSSSSSKAPASQDASTQSTSGGGSSASDNSATQGQNGGESPAEGGGVANAGNHKVVVGKMSYLAPGKLIVKPEDGSTDQAFLVANATKILGAAAICSDDGGAGGASIGDDGYGTAKCTVDELEKAAKTNSVTVRVTMDRKSGAAETVEEKYHP